MAKRNKLIEGNRYNIKLPWGVVKGYYYTGKCESLCWQTCDCCDKELMNGHLFMKPFHEASYKQCIEGQFEDQVTLGTTCIKKVEIAEWQPE